MQMNSWNINLHQDFSLDKDMRNDSWLDVILNQRMIGGKFSLLAWLKLERRNYTWVKLPEVGKVKLNTFNTTSFAINDLARRIQKQKRR